MSIVESQSRTDMQSPEALALLTLASSSPVRTSYPWKDEISERIAAHQLRRSLLIPALAETQTKGSGSVKYTQLAARVAARFAQAPSYHEMLPDGKQKPQAAVVERSLPMRRKSAKHPAVPPVAHAPRQATQKPQPAQKSAAPSSADLFESKDWLQMMVAEAAPPELRITMLQEVADLQQSAQENAAPKLMDSLFPEPTGMPLFDAAIESMMTLPEPVAASDVLIEPAASVKPVAQVETAYIAALPIEPIEERDEVVHPIAANLIASPRELVAVRKARPRLAEGPFAERSEGQLSIFEVEPASIAPMAEMVTEPAQAPTWSMIELAAQPEPTRVSLIEPPVPTETLKPAPWGQRALAGVMDMALTCTACLFIAAPLAMLVPTTMSTKTLETSAVLLLAIVGALYQGLSASLLNQTPGMWYANLRLVTLENKTTTREQRQRRLGTLVLSLLPLGLGMTWALFDADTLCWHDRLSGTYPRKSV